MTRWPLTWLEYDSLLWTDKCQRVYKTSVIELSIWSTLVFWTFEFWEVNSFYCELGMVKEFTLRCKSSYEDYITVCGLFQYTLNYYYSANTDRWTINNQGTKCLRMSIYLAYEGTAYGFSEFEVKSSSIRLRITFKFILQLFSHKRVKDLSFQHKVWIPPALSWHFKFFSKAFA